MIPLEILNYKMKKIILLTFLMTGCSVNESPISIDHYDTPGRLACSERNMIEQCTGSSRQTLSCRCVHREIWHSNGA